VKQNSIGSFRSFPKADLENAARHIEDNPARVDVRILDGFHFIG
jgi:hypothetical protein